MSSRYFQDLNSMLKDYECHLPMLLIDLDILDDNLQRLKNLIRKDLDFRIVVKSLPSPQLIAYIMEKMDTKRLMVFHQPFLSQIAATANDKLDILMGKPMPIKTVEYFYKHHNGKGTFDPFRQVQWLADTLHRIKELIDLSKQLEQPLRINLELDVGLHRGGFSSSRNLRQALEMIQNYPKKMTFGGFMGYDPHVVKLPRILISPERAFREANGMYTVYIDLLKSEFPDLYSNNLTFNGGGSPSLKLHSSESSGINDISVGSALLKPTTFDIPSLSEFKHACFIATPILKKQHSTRIPGIEKLSRVMKWFNKSNRFSYFIYGGYWMADYCYPTDAHENQLFGSSTNQSMVNTSADLDVDDFIFLRPKQSESVLLQFGGLKVIRDGEIVGEWVPYRNG
ncbi:MAG: alanine racemase [Bacteroidia bacterium]|nr:alanine racemase [Bacteroidia bacterium]